MIPSAPVNVGEQRRDQIAARVKGQAGELDHQPAIVAVDGQTGETVALAEDEPVGRLVSAQPEDFAFAAAPPGRAIRTRRPRRAGRRPSDRAGPGSCSWDYRAPGDELSFAGHDVDLVAGRGSPMTRSIDESKTHGWCAKTGARGAA